MRFSLLIQQKKIQQKKIQQKKIQQKKIHILCVRIFKLVPRENEIKRSIQGVMGGGLLLSFCTREPEG